MSFLDDRLGKSRLKNMKWAPILIPQNANTLRAIFKTLYIQYYESVIHTLVAAIIVNQYSNLSFLQ